MNQTTDIEKIIFDWKLDAGILNENHPIYISKRKRKLYIIGDNFSLTALCGAKGHLAKQYKKIIKKNTYYNKIEMLCIHFYDYYFEAYSDINKGEE